ncbi:MAG: hypothetical protein H0T62_05170 [Parachlamydiaceae bacterium]|nr:hypothetical protein [Parachlamydiaceae bacterium]
MRGEAQFDPDQAKQTAQKNDYWEDQMIVFVKIAKVKALRNLIQARKTVEEIIHVSRGSFRSQAFVEILKVAMENNFNFPNPHIIG